MKTNYQSITAYRTRDGSMIRELMHPDVHGNRGQSLAEAIVAPGCTTLLHRHCSSEEIYHITAGRGVMTVGEDSFNVTERDTVCIPPGTPHCIRNSGNSELRILCCCSPPYRDSDTDLL